MTRIDGRGLTAPIELNADVVIVGSGPAGSAVAAESTRLGLSVVVVEAGPWQDEGSAGPPVSAFDSMSRWYRQMGASVVAGRTPMPYVQGRMVGGSSPINGAICWRMPQDVYERWLGEDPAVGEAIPWEALESATDAIESRLGVAPTDPSVTGRKNLLMAAGADAVDLEHRPIRRNTVGCEGLGRCMQTCPIGAKQSADRTLLLDALAAGATVISSAAVHTIYRRRGRVTGVEARAASGASVRARANTAVVLAASAVQTPVLLLRNGIDQGPVGENFQGHPGVSMAGRFAEPVRAWEGATQGHEVTGLRREGLKFEALGFGLDVLASRMHGVGTPLADRLVELDHYLEWGAAVRAEARGRVRVAGRRTIVQYEPTARDIAQFRRGLRFLGEMMLGAGATEVEPGVRGYTPTLSSVAQLRELERRGPRRRQAFSAAVTHMFGTTRLGGDPRVSVVGPHFEHHNVARLFVADSSVFPSNTGVNPQIAIMAVATLCARHLAGAPVAPDQQGDQP